MTCIDTPRGHGRVLAWAALTVALVASVAANVAYARPAVGPRLSSGVAPVLVILAAGLLERVPLAGVQVWRRLLAYVGLGAVIGAAFVTSFEHQFALLLRYGNTRLSSGLLPVAVDGLIVLASVCLTVIAERQRSGARFDPSEPAAQPPTEVGAEGATSNEPDPFVVPAQPVIDIARPARPRATRKAQGTDPRKVEVLRLHAQLGSARKVHEAMNGEAPSLRTINYWIKGAQRAQPEGSDA